jgi:hypothetical protein
MGRLHPCSPSHQNDAARKGLRASASVSVGGRVGIFYSGNDFRIEEVAMPVWAWILIIVLLVLLLTGGIYVRR